MNNFESVKNSVKNLIKIGKKIDFFSIVSTECADVPLKRAYNLTTHQAPKLHPDVEQLLKFDTIYNLYYPEAIAQLEATTVEEFNQNTNNNVEHVYYHYGDDYQSMVVRLCAYAVVILGDVYFRRGKYQPESEEGRKLLTHELTHVAQNKNKEFVDHRTKEELEEEAEFNERTAESIQDPLVTRVIRGKEVTLPASKWHEVSTEVLDVLLPEMIDYERFKRSPEGFELLKKKYKHWKEHHEDEYRW